MKDYNVIINGQNFFDQQIKNDLRTYKTNEKLQQVKKMIIHIIYLVFQFITTPKSTIFFYQLLPPTPTPNCYQPHHLWAEGQYIAEAIDPMLREWGKKYSNINIKAQ